MKQQAHHYSDRHRLLPRWTSPDTKTTFSPGMSESGQNKGAMITATIQPFQTKLSPFGECQQKFADTQTLLFPLCLSPLFLIHLHNPCDTPINNSCLICISMPEIEDRRSHSKYSPARNKLSNVVSVGQGISRGGRWTLNILRFDHTHTHARTRTHTLAGCFLTLHLQSFS